MALRIASSATLLSSSILLLLIASGSSTSFTSSTSFGNILQTGGSLKAGEVLSVGNYKFTMQTDCNLVLYDDNIAIWASNTDGSGNNCRLILQSNGELFIYSDSGNLVWRTETGGVYGHHILVLQPNGNVVVYGSPVWSTGTFTQITANAPPRATGSAPPTKRTNNNP